MTSTSFQNNVLLCVDMQRAFDAPPWPRRWNDDLDRNGMRLLAVWRQSGFPIIHVRHDSVDPLSTLCPGLPGHQFRDGFTPLSGEAVVGKTVNSAFISTDLDLRLRCLGAQHLVVFGISTDMCVSTTVRTGANLGWAITLVADACDCFDLPDGHGGVISAEIMHAAHVATLAYEFCKVVPVEAFLPLVLRSSSPTKSSTACCATRHVARAHPLPFGLEIVECVIPLTLQGLPGGRTGPPT